MKKRALNINKNTLIVLLIGSIFLILLSFGAGIAFRDNVVIPKIQPTPTPTVTPSPTNTSTPTPTPTPIPQVKKGPSERALQAAAFVFVTSDEAYKEQMKEKLGVSSINELAIFLDNHPDKLASVEQIMSLAKNNKRINVSCTTIHSGSIDFTNCN